MTFEVYKENKFRNTSKSNESVDSKNSHEKAEKIYSSEKNVQRSKGLRKKNDKSKKSGEKSRSPPS